MIGYVTALMTAFYMFRLMNLTFYGKPRMSHEVEHHIHESPPSMTVPLMILAVCRSSLDGWLAAKPVADSAINFAHFLEPVFAREPRSDEGRPDRSRPERSGSYATRRISADVIIGRRWPVYWHHGWTRVLATHDKATGADRDGGASVYNTLLNKYYVDEGLRLPIYGRRKLGKVGWHDGLGRGGSGSITRCRWWQ